MEVMMKCPLCGKTHKNQRTAQPCYQEVIMSVDMRKIANSQLSDEDKKTEKDMKKYYFNLPIPKLP